MTGVLQPCSRTRPEADQSTKSPTESRSESPIHIYSPRNPKHQYPAPAHEAQPPPQNHSTNPAGTAIAPPTCSSAYPPVLTRHPAGSSICAPGGLRTIRQEGPGDHADSRCHDDEPDGGGVESVLGKHGGSARDDTAGKETGTHISSSNPSARSPGTRNNSQRCST